MFAWMDRECFLSHSASLVVLLAVMAVLYSCGEAASRQRQIGRLEQQYAREGEQALVDSLLGEYRAYSSDFPDDHERNGRYLFRGAQLSLERQRLSVAVEFLQTAIREHHASSFTPQSIQLLASVYMNKLGQKDLGRFVYSAALAEIPEMDVPEGIEGTAESVNRQLEAMEERVMPEGANVNYRAANDFIQAASLQAMILPESPASPRWLFRAAELAHALEAYSHALELYRWVTHDYPDSPQAPQARFLIGFLLDDKLKDYEEARAAYTTFLEMYPQHALAGDARFLLENLGRPDSEIIDAFEAGEPQ